MGKWNRRQPSSLLPFSPFLLLPTQNPTRRQFLRSGAGGFVASWALGRYALPLALSLARPRRGIAAANGAFPSGFPDLVGPTSKHPKSWTPLDQALARFHNGVDRFGSERLLRALSPSLNRLQSCLLADGSQLEELLSSNFHGSSPTPDSEIVLRSDGCFDVRRAQWQGITNGARDLSQRDFAAALRRFLSLQGVPTFAELSCVAINERRGSGASATYPGVHLRTRIRFELAGKQALGAQARGRWQASGEWEIEWERKESEVRSEELGATRAPDSGFRIQNSDAQSEIQNPKSKIPEPRAPNPEFRMLSWRPLEMVIVRGPDTVFTDVTAAAFGADPTYPTHLRRDTNYWRAILDEASGIDIFGNCGVSVGDADGDGRDEIYLCQPQGLPNRLYRQVRPGVFEDVSAVAGVDLLDATSMALFADVLNRGQQDLILITQSQPLLLLNDGRGRFTLARDAFPVGPPQAALTAAAMADYDNDGFLDLYVCAYGYFQGRGSAPIPSPYYDAHNGPPNRLYRNRGDGTFVDVTEASGLNRGNDRFSFACVWADFDDDGWPDLVVVNDFGRNNLYRNRRDGTFEDASDELSGYGSGMSASFADLDGDGNGELYVGNMWSPAGLRVTADPEFQKRFEDLATPIAQEFAMGNRLYRSTSERQAGNPGSGVGKRGSQQVTDAAGASRGRWAWCSDSFDLENDGRPDIYVVNGYLSSPQPDYEPLDTYLWQEVVALSPHSAAPGSAYRAAWTAMYQLAHQGHPWNGDERNVFFLNTSKGEFVDASAVTGLDFPDDGRSFGVFDYDGDGDADLVLHSRTGPQLRLLRNDIGHSNRSLALRLTATKGNRDAIGARIELETPDGRQVRFLGCGSGFLAQHSKELVCGLGPHSEASVQVRWPGGRVSEYRNLAAGYRYHLVEGKPVAEREPLADKVGTSGLGARGQAGDREIPHSPVAPQAETLPQRFSTWLVDPLPLPPLDVLHLADVASPQTAGGLERRLLWLWDAADKDQGLQPFLQLQKQIASRLVLWNGDSASPVLAALDCAPWRADSRFRDFCSTLLAHLFDYRREPVLPIGLLVETGVKDSPLASAAGTARQAETAPATMSLVKVYWGGATAEELLRDYRSSGKSGVAALPFPGRALLCSFRRDARTLGSALATAGLFIEAEAYLEQASANSRDADALYDLALVRRELGKISLAIAGVKAALAARPEFPEAENLLGVLLMQSGDQAAAQAHLEAATRNAPDFAEAWNNLGYLLLRRDPDRARAALGKAVALAPDFPEALNNLGILSAQQGDGAKADKLFHRALALQPDDEQAANNLGVLYARQGRTQEAVETLSNLLQRNPDAASVLLNLARLEASLGKVSEAQDVLQKWLTRHPTDTTARQLLSIIRGEK